MAVLPDDEILRDSTYKNLCLANSENVFKTARQNECRMITRYLVIGKIIDITG